MEAVAKLRNYRCSPRKIRLVADVIRGMDVAQALNVLEFTYKKSAQPIEKLLRSAVSNWENSNEDIRDADLFIKKVFVDQGTVLKRWQPAPRGMAHRIRKPMSHITIVVDNKSADAVVEGEGEKASEKAKVNEKLK